MGDNGNLKPPINKRPTEEQREIRLKGGIASGKARRIKKTMKEIANSLLNNKISDERLVQRILDLFPEAQKDDMQIQTAMLVAQISKALKGDSKAFEVVRDTSGQKPVDRQEIGFAGTDRVEIKIDGEDVE